MKEEKIYFDVIKEDRGLYFVEYHPAKPDDLFAKVSLTYPTKPKLEQIVQDMEHEATSWLERYPIPMHVCAFDDTGSVYSFENIKSNNHLVCFINELKVIEYHWASVGDKQFPSGKLSKEYLIKTYEGIGYKTSSECKEQANKEVKKIHRGVRLFEVFIFLIPLIAFVLLEFFSPRWVQLLLFFYTIALTVIKWLKWRGALKKSPGEIQKGKEKQLMEHHHYHCLLNPEAFERLKSENFEKQLRENILKESNSLKNNNV